MYNSALLSQDEFVLYEGTEEEIEVVNDLVQTNNMSLQVISCVLLEMALSFLGILTNLLGKQLQQEVKRKVTPLKTPKTKMKENIRIYVGVLQIIIY